MIPDVKITSDSMFFTFFSSRMKLVSPQGALNPQEVTVPRIGTYLDNSELNCSFFYNCICLNVCLHVCVYHVYMSIEGIESSGTGVTFPNESSRAGV